MNPVIAQSLGIAPGSPATSPSSADAKLENAFKTLENLVASRTEGVKLKNYNGDDRTTVVSEALNDMKSNTEAKWAFDFLSKALRKPETRTQLIDMARKSKISATVVAHLVGADRKDRKAIQAACASKSTATAPSNGAGKPSASAGSQTGRQQSIVSPRMTVVTTTTHIFSEKDAAQHIASLNVGGALNGSSSTQAQQLVGASN